MRVLLATDGSAGAEDAVSLVASSLDPDGVDVEIVTVVPGAGGDPGDADREARQQEAADTVVGAARDRLSGAGFRCAASVLNGHAADRIIEQAAVTGAGLVVIGTRGLSGLRRLLAGSVSAKVARYATVPVLVADRGDPIEHVLFAYDGSAASDAALEFGGLLPFRTTPELTVCSAYEAAAPLTSGRAPTMVALADAAHAEDLAEGQREAESTAAEGVARLAAHGLTASPAVVHGSPLDAIAQAAAGQGADLIVVGDRGRSAIERFVLGSTSAGLIAAPPTSVLVVRGAPRGPS